MVYNIYIYKYYQFFLQVGYYRETKNKKKRGSCGRCFLNKRWFFFKKK